MPKLGYLVVEGPHDVEFAYRLLSPFGLKRAKLEAEVDSFFEPLIPRSYPPDGDLLKRMPIPLFLHSQSHAIAIHGATGDSRIVETVEESAALVDASAITGIGILLDSDKDVAPAHRYSDLRQALASKGFSLPDLPGTVAGAQPKLGGFVLPDNATQGTLEDLLLDCGAAVYPSLLTSARAHITAALTDATLSADDKKDLGKPAGEKKAIVGAMASVLRPGKAVQVSIQDNRWLRGPALTLPRLKAIQDFLVDIFELT